MLIAWLAKRYDGRVESDNARRDGKTRDAIPIEKSARGTAFDLGYEPVHGAIERAADPQFQLERIVMVQLTQRDSMSRSMKMTRRRSMMMQKK